MTRYDIAMMCGYNSVEEYDEAERRKHKNEIFTESLKKQKPYVEKESVKIQPVNQWINCKDKMPEDNTSVLFVYVSENGIKSVHYGYHQTLKGLGSSWAKPSGGWQYCDDEVTHWMPLPEPPKDGDTNTTTLSL